MEDRGLLEVGVLTAPVLVLLLLLVFLEGQHVAASGGLCKGGKLTAGQGGKNTARGCSAAWLRVLTGCHVERWPGSLLLATPGLGGRGFHLGAIWELPGYKGFRLGCSLENQLSLFSSKEQ